MYSVYSIPNIILPLFGGHMLQRLLGVLSNFTDLGTAYLGMTESIVKHGTDDDTVRAYFVCIYGGADLRDRSLLALSLS